MIIVIAISYTLFMASSLDILDQALIARLRADGRAPVAALAKELHAARGTIQSRIARLVAEGVIRRFTVEVDPGLVMHTVRALTMIHLTGATPRGVRALLRTIPEIRTLHTTNGSWDLVAELVAGSLGELDGALSAIRSVRGVANTETSILLATL